MKIKLRFLSFLRSRNISLMEAVFLNYKADQFLFCLAKKIAWEEQMSKEILSHNVHKPVEIFSPAYLYSCIFITENV